MIAFFPCAHAGHSLWRQAVKQVVVQLSAQIEMQTLHEQPCLGVLYVSQGYAEHANDILAMLSKELPQVKHWVGCAGHSILAGDLDYGRSGALAVMLSYLPPQSYQVFSGMTAQLDAGFTAHSALVHGNAAPSVHQQLNQLRDQLQCSNIVGGLSDLPQMNVQWAWGGAFTGHKPASIGGGGVQMGGLSGVAFAPGVACMAVGMQACKQQGGRYTITKADGSVVLELDGRPALDVLLEGLDACDGSVKQQLSSAMLEQLQQRLVALAPPHSELHSTCLGPDARVARLLAPETQQQGVVLNALAKEGWVLAVCVQDEEAVRADLRRACAQLWDALTCGDEPAPRGRCISGAIYIRNRGRQSLAAVPQVDQELQMIRNALGPVPLLGFTSSCEVDAADLQHLSAQLLVFTQPLQPLV